MKTIYLAGLISTEKPESIQWRMDAWLGLSGQFHILSPLRGKDAIWKTSPDGGITTAANTSGDIIMRDFHDVEQTDVILACLDNFGSARPLIGTLMELAWAWILRKPVVAFCSQDNYLMRNHPFVKECVQHYFTNLKDTVKFVCEYYGETD